MAAAIPRLTPLVLRTRGLRTAARVRPQGFVCWQCQRQKARRKFHIATVLRKKEDDDDDNDDDKAAVVEADGLESLKLKQYQFSVDELDPDELADYERRSPTEQEVFRNERQQIFDALTSPEAVAEIRNLSKQTLAIAERGTPELESVPVITKPGFWNMGEEDRTGTGEDEAFEGDDLTELGHAELEQHREMREYARIAAWEMPLLSKLATPFKPPDTDHILRFRYTTYMGEDHPAAKKIVIEFCPSDLPDLTAAQRTKLIKLVGVRYNPEKDLVKMSSEMFETQAQNKRYLGDLVDTLMTEAKDASDMFEDVPLDFRHHRFKKRPVFPDEWKFTPARKAQLERERRARLELEQEKVREGKMVHGGEIVRRALAAIPVLDESAVMVEQQRGGKKGRGGKETGGRKMLR